MHGYWIVVVLEDRINRWLCF